MTLDGYPTDLTDRETELRFRLLIIEMPEIERGALYSVVASILNDSDILVKTSHPLSGAITYSHVRWGCYSFSHAPESCEWIPVRDGVVDPELGLHQARL